MLLKFGFKRCYIYLIILLTLLVEMGCSVRIRMRLRRSSRLWFLTYELCRTHAGHNPVSSFREHITIPAGCTVVLQLECLHSERLLHKSKMNNCDQNSSRFSLHFASNGKSLSSRQQSDWKHFYLAVQCALRLRPLSFSIYTLEWWTDIDYTMYTCLQA